jgi:hypothetical protein
VLAFDVERCPGGPDRGISGAPPQGFPLIKGGAAPVELRLDWP